MIASPPGPAIRRTVLVGVVAVAAYVLVVVATSDLLERALGDGADAVTVLLVTHLVPLPVMIVVGLMFVRGSGWWHDTWRETPVWRGTPPRRWMLVFPIALTIQIVLIVSGAPWPALSAAYVLGAVLPYLVVGVGEELYFRGILLTGVRGRHGETTALVISSLLFGLAHAVGALIGGVPAGPVLFEVAGTAFLGATFYAVRRATGTLWVPMLLHGLGDYARWLTAGDPDAASGVADVVVEYVLMAATVALVISVVREDRRRRHSAAAGHGVAEPAVDV